MIEKLHEALLLAGEVFSSMIKDWDKKSRLMRMRLNSNIG